MVCAMAASVVPQLVSVKATGVQPSGTRRFAVLGAGFAGISVAWHLLQHTTFSAPVCVELFDEAGVGGGASGASGGLLHPYNPKGKLLWKGAEGWTAALKLLSIAETTSSNALTVDGFSSVTAPLAWRRGILRLAKQQKHAVTFDKNVNSADDNLKISCLDGLAARELVPGLELPLEGLALYIPQAINIHPQRYLKALWMACESFAKESSTSESPGTQACFRNDKVTSLSDLKGSYEAVIVCLGAQAKLLPELDKLPLTTCRGVVAQLHSPVGSRDEYASEAPNLLFGTWLAVQGGRNLLLGATKDWGSMNGSPLVNDEEASSTLKKLLDETAPFYPSIVNWEVKGWQAGLRAMPPRTSLGSLPLAGCIDELVQSYHPKVYLGSSGKSSQTGSTKWWLFGGLGSRGLIHHAWLGEQVAKAVIDRNESVLPQMLKQWPHPHQQLQISVQEAVKFIPQSPFVELIGVLEGVRFELCSTLGKNFGRYSLNFDFHYAIESTNGEYESLLANQPRNSRTNFPYRKEGSSNCTDPSIAGSEPRVGDAEDTREENPSCHGDQESADKPRTTSARTSAKIRNVSKGVTTSLSTGFGLEEDEKFMSEALREAQKAANIGEVPVGAVVVQEGRIVARAYNRVEAEGDPTAHAEMLCIRSASKRNGDWRLTNATIYVTMEPCAMCAGALLQARVKRVVWGARNTLLGADGSWVSLFPNCELEIEREVGEEGGPPVVQQHPFHKTVEVRREVLPDGCSTIMRTFFRSRRKGEAPAARRKPWWLSFQFWVLFRRLLG